MSESELIALLAGPDGAYQCDARELHARLQVGRDFSSWIKGRVDEYGFIEGVDFLVIDSPNPANQKKGRGGDRRSIDYHLTLDMAKELALVENNEIGRAVRRYFIQAEKELRERQMAELRAMAIHVLPVPGVKGRLRDKVKLKDFFILQKQGADVARRLAAAESELERYALHCQLKQINEVLGYRTPSLAEIAAGGFTQE